jgi:lysophospholipase L1-like esterase
MKQFSIAIMGTSLTQGTKAGASYLRDLRLALQANKKSIVNTFNYGIDGARTTTGVGIVDPVIRLRPNVILIEYLMNDCVSPYTDTSATTKTLLNSLKSGTPNSALYLMTMNPVRGSGSVATDRVQLETYNQTYRNLALSENVSLIDTYPGWAAATLSDIPDGLHASPAANRQYLIPALVSTLSHLID